MKYYIGSSLCVEVDVNLNMITFRAHSHLCIFAVAFQCSKAMHKHNVCILVAENSACPFFVHSGALATHLNDLA